MTVSPKAKINFGKDRNYFKNFEISSTDFQDECETLIKTKFINNFKITNTGSETIEYSFNGLTLHGSLIPGTRFSSVSFSRNINKIWFRAPNGPSSVSINAYSGFAGGGVFSIGSSASTPVPEVTLPLLLSAIVSTNGLNLTLTYDKNLNESSVPDNSDFILSGTSAEPNSVSVLNNTVTITTNTNILLDETVTISYTAGINPIQDTDENNAVDLNNEPITNNSTIPSLLTTGLVAYLDPDIGITNTGDGTEITQAVGIATFTPLSGGTGPVRDDLGWGRMFHTGGTPGFSRAIQFQTDSLVTSDAAVLSTFGTTTSDFTVVALVWTQSSNSNLFVCGIGNPTTNNSITCLMSTTTISMASQSVGGTGTVSTAGIPEIFTRTRFPTLAIWRQTANQHRIYVNDVVTPVLTTTFTWTNNPSTRFAIGARPDVSPDLSANTMFKFFALYNKSLTDEEMLQMGRYLGMRGNIPICGWAINEITPEVWT